MSNVYVKNYSQNFSQSSESMIQSLKKGDHNFESMVQGYSGSLMKELNKNKKYKTELRFLKDVEKKNRSLSNFKNFDFVADVLNKQSLVSQHFTSLQRNVQRQTNKISILEKKRDKLKSHDEFLQSINILNVTHDRYIEKFKELDIKYLQDGYNERSKNSVYNLGQSTVILPLENDKYKQDDRNEVYFERFKH